MLEQFRDRNFILSRFGPGLFGFVHRALLEYCCADEIVYRLNVAQDPYLDELVPTCSEPMPTIRSGRRCCC